MKRLTATSLRFDEDLKRDLDRYVFERKQAGEPTTLERAVQDAVRSFLAGTEGPRDLTGATVDEITERHDTGVTPDSQVGGIPIQPDEEQAILDLLYILRSGQQQLIDAIILNITSFRELAEVRTGEPAPSGTSTEKDKRGDPGRGPSGGKHPLGPGHLRGGGRKTGS